MPQWIKCSERLPHKAQHYFTKRALSGLIIGFWEAFNGQNFESANTFEWLDESQDYIYTERKDWSVNYGNASETNPSTTEIEEAERLAFNAGRQELLRTVDGEIVLSHSLDLEYRDFEDYKSQKTSNNGK